MRQFSPVCRHEIQRFDCPQRHNVFVGSPVSHDTDRLDRQEYGERLSGAFIPAGGTQFLDVNGIRLTQQIGKLSILAVSRVSVETGAIEKTVEKTTSMGIERLYSTIVREAVRDLSETPEEYAVMKRAPKAPTLKRVRVTSTMAVLRVGPGYDSAFASMGKKGEKMAVVGEKGDYYRVNYKGWDLWILKKLVSEY